MMRPHADPAATFSVSLISFRKNYSRRSRRFQRGSLFFVVLGVIVSGQFALAQSPNVQNAQNTVDYKLRTEAHVDPVTLALQLQIPLGNYPGRGGANVPVTLYYSSKLWRMSHHDTTGGINGGDPFNSFKAKYAETTAAGWTSSLDWFAWPSTNGQRHYGFEQVLEKYDLSGKLVPGTIYARTVARMQVVLPDGSRHELRRDDSLITPPTSGAGPDYTSGIFVSVDGSRLRYVAATNTLYMPDGSSIQNEKDANGITVVATHYIDRNGNRNSYNHATKVWTDSVGRTFELPLPVKSSPAEQPPVREFPYTLPGVSASYVFHWQTLSTVLDPDIQPTPQLHFTGNSAMSSASPAPSPYLFSSLESTNKVVAESTPFNPVVLARIVLPNGSSYRFKYNVYGEIVRIDYPTGSYEKLVYGDVLPLSGQIQELYGQANRGVIQRTVYADGQQSSWSYGTSIDTNTIPHRLTRTTTAPDLSYTETLYHKSKEDSVKFGFDDARAGKPFDERVYVFKDGPMLRRTLTRWAYTGPDPGGYGTATRNARPDREVSIILDTGGDALAQATTFVYDGELNIKTETRHDFVPLGQTAAQTADIDTIPNGTELRIDETDYLTDVSTYRDRNLLSLPTAMRVKGRVGGQMQLVSQTEMRYDETSLHPCGTTVGWSNPSTQVRGNPTKVRRWLDTGNTWVETRTEYDQCGNAVKDIDALNNVSEIVYSAAYNHAFPTATFSAVPDPSGVRGSDISLTTSTVYDLTTGLVTQTTDANGQTTKFFYNDPLNRLKAVEPPAGGGRIDFHYNDAPDNLYVRVETALDATRSSEAYQFFDSLGRPVRTFINEGSSPVSFITTDTEYDTMGRVKRKSLPYRTNGGDTPIFSTDKWTEMSYDKLGRIRFITTKPDNAQIVTEYTGTRVTVTDQANRSRQSRMDSLGHLVEVVEAPTGAAYVTNYQYDVLGNLRQIDQGGQRRFLKYDSLSRLRYERNPEQDVIEGLSDHDDLTDNSSWSLQYSYDANGNLLSRTDARSITTTYAYDFLNRNTTVNYSNTTANPDIVRSYDKATLGKGRAWQTYTGGLSDQTATERAVIDAYNAMGQPLVMRQGFKENGAWSHYQIQREYDLSGHITKQIYPSGHSVDYRYDIAGRLADVNGQPAFKGNLGDGVARTYASEVLYAPVGGMSQERYGTNTPVYNKHLFNNRGQLSEIRVSTFSLLAPGQATNWNRGAIINHYSHQVWAGSGTDNNGNLVKQDVFIPTDDQISNSSQTTQFFTYDELNRLDQVWEQRAGQNIWTQDYDIDRWGNRIINPNMTSGAGIPKPQFDNRAFATTNRLYAPGDLNPGKPDEQRLMRYDRSGNLVADLYTGQGTRAYDAENRMVAAQTSPSQTSTYSYSGDGQRVRKNDGGAVVWFVYAMDGNLIAEYNAAAPATSPLKEYGYRDGELLVTAAAATSQTSGAPVKNVALAANGATASASSQYNASFPVSGAINGDRYHLYLADGRYNEWHSAIGASKPDWLQVDFNGSKTIGEIDIITQQDNYNAPVDPTPGTTFSLYGPTSFEVQYWTGSAWATVPGGSVTGNNKVWRKFTFAPVTTSKIRVLIQATVDSFSRIMEIEAYEHSPNETYLSDLDWASMSNSPFYPSISINHSADGKVITLNGVTYGKGLGAHAPTDVRYNLGGNYTTFVCDVGIDDEATTSAGSVVFEVWADGVKLFDSGVMTPTSQTKSINVNVAGRQQLRLIATEAGDGPTWDHADWAGARLLAGTPAGGSASVQWLVADHLGTPRMVVDQTGSLSGVKRHDYLPFGEELFAGTGQRTTAQGYSGDDGVRQKFTGYERDNETKLDFAQARYYAPAYGRFTSPDSFAGSALNPQTLNRFAYVHNNPMKLTDPSGHYAVSRGEIDRGLQQQARREFYDERFRQLDYQNLIADKMIVGDNDENWSEDAGESRGSQKTSTKVRCPPTGDELANNPIIKRALAKAWRDSKHGTPQNHEEGGWIYINPDNGRLIIKRAASGGEGNIDLRDPPHISGAILIATFHTHPYPTLGMDYGPSYQDELNAWGRNVPALVISEKGTRTTGPNRFGSNPERALPSHKVKGYPGSAVDTCRNCP